MERAIGGPVGTGSPETVLADMDRPRDPLPTVSDGAGGIIKALETCFPRS